MQGDQVPNPKNGNSFLAQARVLVDESKHPLWPEEPLTYGQKLTLIRYLEEATANPTSMPPRDLETQFRQRAQEVAPLKTEAQRLQQLIVRSGPPVKRHQLVPTQRQPLIPAAPNNRPGQKQRWRAYAKPISAGLKRFQVNVCLR